MLAPLIVLVYNTLDIALPNSNRLCHADTYSSLPSGHMHSIASLIINPALANLQRFDFNNACWGDELGEILALSL